MYWQIAYIPGGQPIGALDRLAQTVAKRLQALFSRLVPRTGAAADGRGGPA